MNYLQAFNSRGFLHASTCDTPEGFGEKFTRLMESQGCTVKCYTMAEYRQLRAQAAATLTVATDLPEVGTLITHPVHGAGVVKGVLPHFEGTGAFVLASRHGEHLMRPGTYALAPEPAPEPEPLPVVSVPVVPVPPGQWFMPGLFEAMQ
ncbi:hypothetical protein [Deinococcus aquatilis]|uniref:hypothetical protein n=1 Tax=Deinococcus aquatilis TaxID=519440 RepID=UPI00038139CF|nr:hypothetical protein [Deinococcus aquatilis]